jgi:hypothetical protein
MNYELETSLSPGEAIERAKRFFATRVPHAAAFVEAESPTHLVLRGQGGEEIVFSVTKSDRGTAVRASSLLFGQQVSRFLSTLPPAAGTEAA